MISNSSINSAFDKAYKAAKDSKDPMMGISKYLGYVESELKSAISFLDDNGQSSYAKEILKNIERFRP